MVQMITSETAEPNAVIRVRFKKRGSLSYIAHLDLVRTFTKAIARAGIPVRFSEGFNPHPKFSFATAMSIGLESECEFADIRLCKMVDEAVLLTELNRNLTKECAAEEAYYPTTKFSDIAFSSYYIRIETDGACEALAETCNTALRASEVVVFKRSKSGDKDTDIAPFIRDAAVSYEEGALVVRAMLTADNAHFLNPEYLVTYLKKSCGILQGSLLTERYTLLRTGLYTADGVAFR